MPIIASLNANSVGGWVRFAKLMADAGADALELNLYRISVDRTKTAVDIEDEDLELIAAVRAAVNLPLAVKLSPYYSALANFAGKVVEAGANGLVLFNRFYQPDIDLEELAVVPRVSLSHPSELRLPMRWTAILRPQLGPEVSIAATSGIHSGSDAVKALMVGADVAMVASAVLRDGPGKIADIESEMRHVARGERVQLGHAAARFGQPGQRRGPGHVRASPVHPHAALLECSRQPHAYRVAHSQHADGRLAAKPGARSDSRAFVCLARSLRQRRGPEGAPAAALRRSASRRLHRRSRSFAEDPIDRRRPHRRSRSFAEDPIDRRRPQRR